MPDLCSNCGADLYEGQQFCRRCGTPVRAAARGGGEAARGGGEAPTQLFAPGVQSPAASAGQTSAAAAVRGETGAVGVQQPTAYHPLTNMQQTSPLVGHPFGSQPLAVGPPAPPPARRRRGVWLLALLTVFVLGALLASGAAFLWWRATRRTVVVKRVGPEGAAPRVPQMPAVPPVPPVPADLGDRIKEALKGAGVPLPIDESGATVTATDTVLTQTYELDSASAFAVHGASGNVTVKGTEGDRAVVKITKRGGSPEQRRAAPVLASKSEKGLTLLTAPGQGVPVSVSYEVSLPRNLRRLEISAERGDIKVEGFDGAAVLNLTNGTVTVASGGEVRSKVVNGKTSVTYDGPREEAQEFSVVNGDVEVSFTGEREVELRAASTNGRIEAAEELAAKVEKRGGGQRLETQLGDGGARLMIKVANGNIKLK